MSDTTGKIIAAHYFYLLKEDEQSLRKLWAAISDGSDETTAPAGLKKLFYNGGTLTERCSILHTATCNQLDMNLAMLPNLVAIELLSRKGSDPSRQDWLDFMAMLDGYRSKAAAEGVSIFGETTILVSPESGIDDIVELVSNRNDLAGGLDLPAADTLGAEPVMDGRLMTSELDPAQAGGGEPRLIKIPGREGLPVDYYALTAPDPERVISTLFPDLDSRLKEIERTASYFGQQRATIVEERSQIEAQVGNLLHQQVLASAETDADTAELESRIASLSKMFGLLATDSLMVRQADKRLEHDLEELRRGLTGMMSQEPDARDEIGDHYLAKYSSELKAVRNVTRDLDYSRQNAEAAIEVVRTQVELVRAGEESAIQGQTKKLLKQMVKLQEEGLAIQVAAGLIEFVLIFYYVLLSWEHIIGVHEAEEVPPLLRMLPIIGIAGGATFGTHFLARSIKNHTWRNPGLWIAGAILVLSLAALVILTLTLT